MCARAGDIVVQDGVRVTLVAHCAEILLVRAEKTWRETRRIERCVGEAGVLDTVVEGVVVLDPAPGRAARLGGGARIEIHIVERGVAWPHGLESRVLR